MKDFELKDREWGYTIELPTDDGKYYSEGINVIGPGAIVPFHMHEDDTENYKMLTEGLEVVVLTEEEMKASREEILQILKKKGKRKEGETVTCPKGSGHALYNASNKVGLFYFEKSH